MSPTALHRLFPQATCKCHQVPTARHAVTSRPTGAHFFLSVYLLFPDRHEHSYLFTEMLLIQTFFNYSFPAQLLWETFLIPPHNVLLVANTLGNMLYLQKNNIPSLSQQALRQMLFLLFLKKKRRHDISFTHLLMDTEVKR